MVDLAVAAEEEEEDAIAPHPHHQDEHHPRGGTEEEVDPAAPGTEIWTRIDRARTPDLDP